MILWLASYPRSGNTLLRMVLKRAFGRDTYSAHADDAADIGADPATAAAVGHQLLGEPWPAAYARMASSPELFPVKTHDPPPDAAKAVYVVRDGRASCQSFHCYLHDFAGEATITPTDVILGLTPFGSWGEHLDRWDPLGRPDTLLLRYEDLLADAGRQIDTLAAFTGLAPTADWRNDFAALHGINPRFFRAGPAADPSTALSPSDADLFWAEHGDWMRRLGYGDGPTTVTPATRRRLLGDRGRTIVDLRAKTRAAEDRAADAAATVAEERSAVVVREAHAAGRMVEGRALMAEQVTTIDRMSADRSLLRRQLREARRDAALGRDRIAQSDRLAGQIDALRGQRVELQQRVEQTQRAAYLSQKQYAATLQDQHKIADVLAAAVGELAKRQRLLLSSRLLRLGWAFGFGSTPYWAEAGRDELTPLLDALRPSEGRAVPPDLLQRLTGRGPPAAAGEMDRALRHLLAKGFRPSAVLDVGSAKGYWSVTASGVWPAAVYTMIDPLPQSEPALRELCDRDPRFRYLLVAVGAEPGETTMNVPPDPDSASLLGDPDPDPARRQPVPIETIDRLIHAGRLPPPQLVKLDVQGFELNVLAGGQRLFDLADVFIVESNLFEFMPGCPRLHEVVAHMAGRGFYPFDLAGTLRRPFEDDLGQVDVVFVRGTSPMVARTQWVDDPPTPSPGTPGEGGGEGGFDQSTPLAVPNHPHPNPVPAYRETQLPSVSVVICTRNPRPDVFARTLASLDAQTFADFDLLIVDNGSTPPLDVPGRRVIIEPEPGLSAARCAGIAAAAGDVLVFVDDDNFLAPDYLERARQIAAAEPRVGLFGGIAKVELERLIPRWKRQVLPYLGVRDYGPKPITAYADYWGEWEPIGAGMVARREVAERFVEMYRTSADARQLGRNGAALLSGEDTLFARAAHRAGLACSYQPGLVLTHYMKASRLKTTYLARLLAGHGRSYVLLHRAMGKPAEELLVRTAVARLFYRLRTAGRAGLVTWFWDLGYAAERRRERRAR